MTYFQLRHRTIFLFYPHGDAHLAHHLLPKDENDTLGCDRISSETL